jgi:hypothetical protein
MMGIARCGDSSSPAEEDPWESFYKPKPKKPKTRFQKERADIKKARARRPLAGGLVLPGAAPGVFLLFEHGADSLGSLQYVVAPLEPHHLEDTSVSRRREAARLRGEGKSRQQIADALKVHTSTVDKDLRRHEATLLYREGQSIKEIAAALMVPIDIVQKDLRSPPAAVPALEGAVAAKSRVLQITSFHSMKEEEVKGIGSALLGRLVETAETHRCDHIVVLLGVNHPVYEAFGFRLINPDLDTWWMRTSELKARVGQRPVDARPRFRESPL